MNKKFLLLLIPITTLVLSGCGKRSPGGSTSGDDPTTGQPTSGAPTSGTTGGSSGTTGTTGGSSTTGSSSSSSSGTTSGSTSGSTSEDPGHYVPVHAGTEADPFDAVDAYNVAAELESCKSASKKAEMDTDQQYFVRGVVTEFVEAWSSEYGNYHFKIGDSQTPFIGYRLFDGPTKAKFPLGTELEVGDTVTMYATLIHWYNDMETNDGYIQSIQKATTKTLESITLSGQKTSYIEGQSFVKPVVTAHYSDETENEVTASAVFTGFDSSTPVASQTINVSYTEGGVEKTTSYTVTINAKKLSSIAVSGQKTSYVVGETFVKPTVTATYDNETNAVVTESAVFTGFDSSAAVASQTINVSYIEGGVEKTTSYTVTINASAIHVTAVSIDSTLELNVGDTHTLVPTISPDNATDKTVTWAVEGDSPAGCVTVDEDSGLITANAAGTANVVVTTNDGGLSDSCAVTVTASAEFVATTMTKGASYCSDFTVNGNEAIKMGTSSNAASMTVAVPSGAKTLQLYVSAWKGQTSGTVTLSCDGVTISPSTLNIFADECFTGNETSFTLESDIETYKVTAISLTGVTSAKDITISTTGGCKRAIVWSPAYSMSVVEAEPVSLLLDTSSVKTSFNVNDTFTSSGLVAKVRSSDSTSETVTPASISTPDMTTAGEKVVTVTYGLLSATYSINVSETSGNEVTVDFSAQGYGNQEEVTTVTSAPITITFAQGTGSNPPKYYTSGAAVRAYGGNTVTFSTSTGSIAQIVITFSSGEGTNAITANVGTYNSSTKTWTGSATSITLTIGGTSGHRRFASVVVTYA